MNSLTEPAISRAIKLVGIGKKGSKALPPELISELLTELKTGVVTDIAKGAFFAGLWFKSPTPEEMHLNIYFSAPVLDSPEKLADALTQDAPPLIQKLCVEILSGKELSQDISYRLGQFLLSDQKGDAARGLVASALRVRYETPEEYTGLLRSIQETIAPSFKENVPEGKPIIQIAEPFDGVDHSYMITPLLADFMQTLNFRVISMVGRNSGPKFVYNLLDLAKALNLDFLKRNHDLRIPAPEMGWYVDQKDLSPALDRWVDLRKQIIKRPFLATLEKFVNPANAHILITSAFHAPYGEKMTMVAERAGFPGSIVVRNGMEGYLAFPLLRPVKILCSARQEDGTYMRNELTFDPRDHLGLTVQVEEKFDVPSLEENVQLIKEYSRHKTTSYHLFNYRVQATCAGLKSAIDWVQENVYSQQVVPIKERRYDLD